MLPLRTMTSLKSSNKTSAAASKIKNKILNTSSFFKVSLKTNNKALAVALEVQKERSRELEMNIVYLQKQVEALCFELATMKYKHRKLHLILKNVHSNLDMVADLFPDTVLPKLSGGETLSGDVNKEVGSLTDQIPPQPGNPGALLCPLQKVTVDLAEKNICANVFDIQNQESKKSAHICNDNTDAEKRHSSQFIQTPQTGTSRPSSSLRDEVERLSVMFSRSECDMKPAPCPQNSQTPSVVSMCEKPKRSLSDAPLPSNAVMETEPEHVNKHEKTVLLNTTMEMTLSNATDIVTVETKAKKRGHPGKPKGKKNKEQDCGSSAAQNPQVKNSDCRSSEVQIAPVGTLIQTEDDALEGIRDPEVVELQSPKTQCRSVITSRIPKLSKPEAGTHQKTALEKSKSRESTKSKTVLPDVDDYFMDPQMKMSKASEKVKLAPETDHAEEPRFKVTCRRSRTKGRRVSSFIRKTFVTLPPRESESSPSTSELVRNEEEGKESYEACKDPQDKVKAAESDPVANNPQSQPETSTTFREGHKSKCRGTFVISVGRDSTSSNRASAESVSAVEQDVVPSAASSNWEARKPPAVTDVSVVRQRSESNRERGSVRETHSSCKRPWLATLDSGSSSDIHAALPLDHGCTSQTEFQKPKKAKREATSRSSKKKAAQREESVHCFSDVKKKTSRYKGFGSEDEACCLGDRSDASPFRGVGGPERNKEQLHDLQVDDSRSDVSEKDHIFQHLHESIPSESKSSTDWNPKRCRETSKLQTPADRRTPRETFVVYMHQTQDKVPLKYTRTSRVSGVYGHTMDASDEAVHQSLGDLLTDEMPPWLSVDVSAADTEAVCLLDTPKRPTSGRVAVTEESPAVTTESSPAGRVLTSLTNTITTPDSENSGRTRRRKGVVSYKEPPLNSKIRRGDKFTDSMFLSSPVFKGGKKKRKKQQNKTVTNPKLEGSLFED